MDIKTLITKSKRLLKQGGHNVTDIIEKAGVEPSTVWKLEAGKAKKMQPLTACKLELGSPNREFDCEKLNPEAFEAYRQIFERRGVLKKPNRQQVTDLSSPV